MYQKISYQDYLRLKNESVVIDVKDEKEFIVNHLPNAINIPLNKIVNILNIVKDKNKKIIIYCSNGKRSYIAARSIINLGYKYVYDLDTKK